MKKQKADCVTNSFKEVLVKKQKTEKLLLYGGAVQLAGSVTARKNQRATTSDWMELEKKRGISISSQPISSSTLRMMGHLISPSG